MKYEIQIHRTQFKALEVEAGSAEEAIKSVRVKNPGWSCGGATQMDENGEPVMDFEVQATCENCERLIFDDGFETDAEGVSVCDACAQALHEPNQDSED